MDSVVGETDACGDSVGEHFVESSFASADSEPVAASLSAPTGQAAESDSGDSVRCSSCCSSSSTLTTASRIAGAHPTVAVSGGSGGEDDSVGVSGEGDVSAGADSSGGSTVSSGSSGVDGSARADSSGGDALSEAVSSGDGVGVGVGGGVGVALGGLVVTAADGAADGFGLDGLAVCSEPLSDVGRSAGAGSASEGKAMT